MTRVTWRRVCQLTLVSALLISSAVHSRTLHQLHRYSTYNVAIVMMLGWLIKQLILLNENCLEVVVVGTISNNLGDLNEKIFPLCIKLNLFN